MHGKPSSLKQKCAELMNEINREMRRPLQDRLRLKNLWMRVSHLHKKGECGISYLYPKKKAPCESVGCLYSNASNKCMVC